MHLQKRTLTVEVVGLELPLRVVTTDQLCLNATRSTTVPARDGRRNHDRDVYAGLAGLRQA